ncbi:ATPase domain-containing protein [Novosphingobium sp. P6W]|uniref:ATPase domain-containing protein n=1 Tax=Novosphingobium sp. P6W TaxID=1609758 RepID=UPI0005C2DC9C|nr:ATPase domain-containing protein [Novosphingobium sp. P6W]AXB79340.1 circadian clock protein KaiC [Novosphingobium sp. P6W]KIS34117.1 circadian clock protein KaiC [Novosphingobium sp. P6W]
MAYDDTRISTGNSGLDKILRGGLPPNRVYLVEGSPGSGKTTLSLGFLLDGKSKDERTLYITLSETSEEMKAVAESHGWSLDGVTLFELASADEVLGPGREQSILHSWEMELGGTIQLIKDEVERIKPSRVVFDSLSEMRLLAQDPLRYRRQLLYLKQFFAGLSTTVILVDDLTGSNGGRDNHLHSLCHGVITLERLTLDFGAARRRLQVQKLRGVDFVAGYHDLIIRKGGLDIFPRLIASDFHTPFLGEAIASEVPELDALLGGGPANGTSTLITGPAGSGKTTLALQYVAAACRRGERAVIYEFDERIGTLIARAMAFGIDLQSFIDGGCLAIRQIDPAEIAPGEFSAMVRAEIENNEARVIVIDSLNGYVAAMPQEQQLILQLHELLSYLNQAGVATFLINPQQGFFGTMSTTEINVSYIADIVILLRFFEADGRIRKAISVVKNRSGSHEDTIREFRVDARGVRVGEALSAFRGVLTGTPQYTGSQRPLLEDRGSGA